MYLKPVFFFYIIKMSMYEMNESVLLSRQKKRLCEKTKRKYC